MIHSKDSTFSGTQGVDVCMNSMLNSALKFGAKMVYILYYEKRILRLNHYITSSKSSNLFVTSFGLTTYT